MFSLEMISSIIAICFLFNTIDSAAGMGFGTAVAPLLFLLGYDPLEVVPTLLVAQSINGLVAGMFHHEFENVSFSLRPLNKATKVMLLLAGVGCLGIILSIFSVYLAVDVPDHVIKGYVSALIIVMGFIGLYQAYRKDEKEKEYNPRLLAGFAVVAGINKGVGGGGYGPVLTLGQIFSGIYEKSATAIVTVAEGLVSIIGCLTFFALMSQGVAVDFYLLPSVFTGSFFAAILGPYLVRLLPNRILRVAIPVYAFLVGIASFLNLTVFA